MQGSFGQYCINFITETKTVRCDATLWLMKRRNISKRWSAGRRAKQKRKVREEVVEAEEAIHSEGGAST